MLGSCFSEHIGAKLTHFKFRTTQNPFGILFHPLAIENVLSRALKKEKYTTDDVFFNNDRWHCFDAHSVLSHSSKEALLQALNQSLETTFIGMRQATHICITLGTAWVYRHKETNKVVANCHKVPQVNFTKELLDSANITKSLITMVGLVHDINPTAQFVFTVSPVRHLKDGFVQNQRSKSHLITALHAALSVPALRASGLYFPSYEIMMDELRDYRFYGEDMLHPNTVAINYIWEKFREVCIEIAVFEVMERVNAIQTGLNHRAFNPTGEAHQKFIKSLQAKIADIQQGYPFMDFNTPEL